MEKDGIDPRPGNIDEQGETKKKTWKPFLSRIQPLFP